MKRFTAAHRGWPNFSPALKITTSGEVAVTQPEELLPSVFAPWWEALRTFAFRLFAKLVTARASVMPSASPVNTTVNSPYSIINTSDWAFFEVPVFIVSA